MKDGAEMERAEARAAMRTVPQSAHGEPIVWLAGGALAVTVLVIAAMMGLIAYQGGRAFWADPIELHRTLDGKSQMGVVQDSTIVPKGQEHAGARRLLIRTENYQWTGSHAVWAAVDRNAEAERPEWATLIERRDEGPVVGMPTGFLVEGKALHTEAEDVLAKYEEYRDQVESRRQRIRDLESDPEANAEVLVGLRKANSHYELQFTLADGTEAILPMEDIVRIVTPNRIGLSGKLGVFLDRWIEFLTDEPRHANSQGGIWPALFGTVIMTMIMTLMVVPFGVLTALYLKEYAKAGFFVSMVRIAVNNLAGVPSIVFGVFGLSFFCYIVGTTIDEWFFSETLPNPTFGKGGILWASLTLALLTLPVVIVATEEALSAVPQSMREGSYGCGATRWQTIRRVVLPRAMPGILTGMILAIARGAGEVAPLMLVGAVKMAPDLPVDLAQAPYLFPQRSFMHLGFHIYDLGFQSQDSEAARPMVFATTLLLIAIVVGLNLTAIWIRARLRKRFRAAR
ncbi:MAG: phosphate ABC transporter permease PstA [Planctomycetes bacterium]|nr:phosphate ABC transporter permease PstA [Planctomycetota bacterium]